MARTLPARRLASLLCLGLAACGSATRQVQEQAAAQLPDMVVPASWYRATPGDGNLQLAQWWRHFGDARLAALVEQALQHTSSLAAASARLQQARALRDVAAARLSGQLNTNISAESVRLPADTLRRWPDVRAAAARADVALALLG